MAFIMPALIMYQQFKKFENERIAENLEEQKRMEKLKKGRGNSFVFLAHKPVLVRGAGQTESSGMAVVGDDDGNDVEGVVGGEVEEKKPGGSSSSLFGLIKSLTGSSSGGIISGSSKRNHQQTTRYEVEHESFLHKTESIFTNIGVPLVYSILMLAILFDLFLDGVELETVKFTQPNGYLAYIVPIARGCGMGLNLCVMLVMFLMCRDLLNMAQSTSLSIFIPFQLAYDFHIIMAILIGFLSFIHGVGQIINFSMLDLFHSTTTTWVFSPFPVFITGVLLWVVYLIMGLPRVKLFRKYARLDYQVFVKAHVFWVLFVIICILHGVEKGTPVTWKWVVAPFAILLLERIHQKAIASSTAFTSIVLNGSKASSGVVRLELLKGTGFVFKAGHYLQICIPNICENEWHPFTIASGPEEDVLVLLVKKVGNWTTRLYEGIENKSLINAVAQIKGPFGAPTEFALQYPNAVFVCAGIGATPFLSVLKDFVMKSNKPIRLFSAATSVEEVSNGIMELEKKKKKKKKKR